MNTFMVYSETVNTMKYKVIHWITMEKKDNEYNEIHENTLKYINRKSSCSAPNSVVFVQEQTLISFTIDDIFFSNCFTRLIIVTSKNSEESEVTQEGIMISSDWENRFRFVESREVGRIKIETEEFSARGNDEIVGELRLENTGTHIIYSSEQP